MPARWMLGGADLLLWRDADGGTHYMVHTDPLRGLFLRNEPPGTPIDAPEREALLALAASLPPGDALVVQRSESRGAFPPIGRPAVTSVAVTDDAIELTSRANVGRVLNPSIPSDGLRARPTFPRGALLAATFTDAPRVVDDLNRLFGTKVSPLLANGGAIAIYDVGVRIFVLRIAGLLPLKINPLAIARPADLRGLVAIEIRPTHDVVYGEREFAGWCSLERE